MEQRNSSSDDRFDILIVGGGATGLGCAVDAASRGYRTALLEAHTFGFGTSGRSTKLIHGGVRYMAQLRFGLVKEGLSERTILLRNAPQAVWPVAICIPAGNPIELGYFAAGLKLYDALAGRGNIEPSRVLLAQATRERIPNLQTNGIFGSIRYVDAQFDEAGLLAALAATARGFGADLRENARVTRLTTTNGRVDGVAFHAAEGPGEQALSARVVINATGPGADAIRRMSDPQAKPMLAPGRGSHLFLSAGVLGGNEGLFIPKTDDGRVIFALPYQGRTLVGTTEIPVSDVDEDPRASDEEIDYLIAHLNRYLVRTVTRADVLGTYAGLRPLIAAGATKSASLSREHLIDVDAHGLLSVLGGKWTSYRRMAKDAIDAAAPLANLRSVASVTERLPLGP